MAGYVHQRKVYKLTFDDPEMGGLVVRVRGLTTGELLQFSRLRGTVDDAEAADAAERMLRQFAAKLVSWNLEEPEGMPVPATYEALLGLDDDFVMTLVDSWVEAVAGVPAPLGPSSNGGGPSPVASPPTEPSSASRAS
ncbi:MAG TPA: hypothetical protein VIV12_06640 [Streptosporangiaceae bacterium]